MSTLFWRRNIHFFRLYLAAAIFSRWRVKLTCQLRAISTNQITCTSLCVCVCVLFSVFVYPFEGKLCLSWPLDGRRVTLIVINLIFFSARYYIKGWWSVGLLDAGPCLLRRFFFFSKWWANLVCLREKLFGFFKLKNGLCYNSIRI